MKGLVGFSAWSYGGRRSRLHRELIGDGAAQIGTAFEPTRRPMKSGHAKTTRNTGVKFPRLNG